MDPIYLYFTARLDMGITQGYFVHKTRSWLLISIRLAFHSVRDLLGEELLSRQRVISCIGTGAVVIFFESASHPWKHENKIIQKKKENHNILEGSYKIHLGCLINYMKIYSVSVSPNLWAIHRKPFWRQDNSYALRSRCTPPPCRHPSRLVY